MVFREEDLNVIFYQNMPNLHNRYKSAERKISQNQGLPGACNRSDQDVCTAVFSLTKDPMGNSHKNHLIWNQ
jgi:hypothetical protein